MAIADDRVSGKPSKAFFIDMIVRDLGITDCILDLIDNSIDHAVTTTKADVMALLVNGHRPRLKKYYVSLKLSSASFTIDDNCGGISIADAQSRVFRFGDPQGKRDVAGLSVYGIGMKRAFFKLGDVIRVQSATDKEWFVLDINVKRWKARGDDNWDFEFTDKGLRGRTHFRYPPRTTKLTVAQLHKATAARLGDAAFLQQLTRKIGATYGLFLSAGLGISVNSTKIEAELPIVGKYNDLTPARREFKTGEVDTLIIAGVTPREDRRPHGWYVFCNGRMVLEADRSKTTGWGENLPQWHSKYGHFVGYVYFRSSDVRALPWTTTKQSVVFESPVYQAALSEMQIQARPVLNFLGNLYPDDLTEDEVAERDVLVKAQRVAVTDLPRKQGGFSAHLRKRDQGRGLVNIQYAKPRALVDRVRDTLARRQMSAGAVGAHTFDYYVQQELE